MVSIACGTSLRRWAVRSGRLILWSSSHHCAPRGHRASSRHATTLIGRAREVVEVANVVRAQRVVTLTGVGGVGKTRPALQVAAELRVEFPDGMWFVKLAPIRSRARWP